MLPPGVESSIIAVLLLKVVKLDLLKHQSHPQWPKHYVTEKGETSTYYIWYTMNGWMEYENNALSRADITSSLYILIGQLTSWC